MSGDQTEFQRRLYNAAEAFYYSGIIASVLFDAANVCSQSLTSAAEAGKLALDGRNRINQLGAPPIVNLGFSVELYVKLLISLAGHEPPRGHNLHKLFLKLAEISPVASACVIEHHRYSCGCEREFLEYIEKEAKIFEEWRYAYEREFIFSSKDTIFHLADAFRDTVRKTYPDFRSAFDLTK